VADFRTCGLTHLAAVSGTNLTLVVGFVLVLARWMGVRARALTLVGLLGVLGFVLLARPEPSVLRAAVMGSVALIGMGSHGHDRGARALGAAVLVLLLLDPWLALSLGFVLSSLATAGILFLGPYFRDALLSWMPRWAAEALAVPFAAQIACTPVVAAISGQVSLVAVVANLAVAAAVGPATVLGLVGGLLTLVAPPLGHACGWLAGLFGGWIVTVAVHLARLPTAAVEWPAGAVSVGLLTMVCLALALGAGPVLRRARWSLAVSALLVVVMLRPLPTPGWPPRGWVLVACDVGQGDGLVVNAGRGSAMVVDTGPDPAAIDGCLSRLEVRSLPVVVLTHFHADHVDGLPGVLERRVGEVDVTGAADPASGAEQVRRWAAAAGVPVRVPAFGEVRRLGTVTWQVIGPVRSARAVGAGTGGEGSAANNASLVLLVEAAGVRMLLTGDIEPDAQTALARAVPGLQVDVLKVPHHGSRYQDADLLTGLGARLALVSAGAHNDYGHPAQSTLALLHRAGMSVRRTDQAGDVAVTVEDGELRVYERGSR
jgi:competence protein ComEC